MRQLILQDRHVTYREIETTLGISGTSIHSILHEHLTVNKICSRWIAHNLSIAQNRSCSLVERNAPIFNICFCSLIPKYKRDKAKGLWLLTLQAAVQISDREMFPNFKKQYFYIFWQLDGLASLDQEFVRITTMPNVIIVCIVKYTLQFL